MNGKKVSLVSLILLVAVLIGAPQCTLADPPLVKKLTLEYPNPAIPYYHLKAELEVPEPSMLDVEVSVDGEKLRFVTVKDAAKPLDLTRPLIHYRPPFADTYAVNSTTYTTPIVIAWVPWRAGKEYRIDIKVRMRKDLKPSDTDTRLSATATVPAPHDAKTFDPQWKDYKAIVLTETAGLDRKGEPVEVLLSFYADQGTNLTNSIRVVAVDPITHAITEVPSQVYDINTDVPEGDPRPPNEKGLRRQVRIWVPTITARVAFLADVPGRTSRVYLVYHNNPGAKAPKYETDLTTSGPAPGIKVDKETQKVVGTGGFTIANDKIKVVLHQHSGVLDELTLKSKPNCPLYHRMETNGAIHWAPEAYPPPRPWTHTSDWKEPKFESWKGPVVVTTLARGALPYIPEVDAAVSYKVYPNLPYIISTTATRVNETIPVQAMRNGEIVFKRGLLTHLAWYDVIERKVQTVDLETIADLDEHLMEVDVPWIAFFNPKTGIAFGGVQIEFASAALEHLPRVWNPYHYVIVGPIVYWARALNFTFASSASQHMIEVPEGTHLWEKWGFVLYEPADGENPHAPLLEWREKLINPLRVRLVEEVESRVPIVGTEIYIDPSKTGWEERETKK